MISLQEAREKLLINKNNLDEECKHQPELYYEVASNSVKAISERDRLKEEKDATWSKTFITNKMEGRLEGKSLSDKTAETFADTDEYVLKSNADYLKAKEEADEWIALKESYQQRALMLKELCGLYVAGYFGEISVKTKEASEVELKNKRKLLRQH